MPRKSSSITITCAHCGRDFQRTPSRVGRFCSHDCYNQSRKVAHVCPRCGGTFYRKACQTTVARFCSRACKERETPDETAQRFWSRVDKSGECWEWTASLVRTGYGRFRADGACISAHRWAYQWAYGPILDGVFVCHSCDNPRCVNPAHLFPGTAATNTDDMLAKERNVRGERCHTAKLTIEQVREIRRIHACGTHSRRQLAALFGVRPKVIWRVVRRETWRHV